MSHAYTPTSEQEAVIGCTHDAFISACPGAGKTRTLVERARVILRNVPKRQGIAFLSFTNAAVSELQDGLQREGLLPSPAMPHFIGTFDSFIWHFFVAPFGIPGVQALPRLIPDKDAWNVRPPFANAQALKLKCFDRMTGAINAKLAAREGFFVALRAAAIPSYVTAAKSTIDAAWQRGDIDFADARAIAKQWLSDATVAGRLKQVLAARFYEVVVDEAQDCNAADLAIIDWFRQAGIVTKVICDPDQAIYGFRGGVGDELSQFAGTFSVVQRLPMKGNFRSSQIICDAIATLRAPSAQADADIALGKWKAETVPIHVLAYGGTAVPKTIGEKFAEIITSVGLLAADCPVLAKTWDSAGNAVGQPMIGDTTHSTLRLASSISDFHFAVGGAAQKKALDAAHRIILEVEGHLATKSYAQYLLDNNLQGMTWRPRVLDIVRALRFDSASFADSAAWLTRARELLAPTLIAPGATINQRLKTTNDLAKALSVPNVAASPAQSIHSVKGKQFPGVCVVMTTRSTKAILDYLDGQTVDDADEDAREVYVAASRAERLLTFALPNSGAAKLVTRLSAKSISFTQHQL